MYAPICIATYNRIYHLKKTIDSLKKNELAKKSILYIFSDGPKKQDEDSVKQLRSYTETIDGFKDVIIFKQKDNNIKQNLKKYKKIALQKYGKAILLEDDNICSPLFLTYMNYALNFFKKNKDIFAINGYNIPCNYKISNKNNFYLSIYFNAWGYATWQNRMFTEIINQNNNAYLEICNSKSLAKKIQLHHPFLIQYLKKVYEGQLDASDYKIVYHLIKNNQYCIKPLQSYVRNIGHDGSGLRCSKTTKFNNKHLNNSLVKFSNSIHYVRCIDRAYFNYFHPTTKFLDE